MTPARRFGKREGIAQDNIRQHVGRWPPATIGPVPGIEQWARTRDLDAVVWTALPPKHWLLTSREKGIAEAPGEGTRGALDHLLVDQDARPTLAVVKRGWNPEIRRTVVGQPIEYAAHAGQTWTAERTPRTRSSYFWRALSCWFQGGSRVAFSMDVGGFDTSNGVLLECAAKTFPDGPPSGPPPSESTAVPAQGLGRELERHRRGGRAPCLHVSVRNRNSAARRMCIVDAAKRDGRSARKHSRQAGALHRGHAHAHGKPQAADEQTNPTESRVPRTVRSCIGQVRGHHWPRRPLARTQPGAAHDPR